MFPPPLLMLSLGEAAENTCLFSRAADREAGVFWRGHRKMSATTGVVDQKLRPSDRTHVYSYIYFV